MEGLLNSERKGKIILISLVLLLLLLIVSIIKLITGSWIVGVLGLLGLLWWLLRQVGALVMYPGSFFLTRSDIQMRYSREIGGRMVACFNALHALSQCVAHRAYHPYQQHADFVLTIDRHIRSMTAMLAMFEATLSPRKSALLRNYQQLSECLQAKEGEIPSVAQLIERPRLISSLQETQMEFYRTRFVEITAIIREMVQALKAFAPPTETFKLMKFRLQEENLYEIRFGFYNWGALYDYELFTIHSDADAHIQSAIIHNSKRRFNQAIPPPNPQQKTVLFCNPNGVFIQFFGADNEYITNYLAQGYHVVLWNYRGYGQSTGTPSISRSQQDAHTVYQFYHSKGYKIEIVHGYSIGGAAAVGLMDKLSKQPQLPGDRVRVLIVDRSFSSIGQMSIEFGKAIYNLTRVIFFADNIDLSKQFESFKGRKLLIWDYCDQVIPDRASVKNRIIKRRRDSKGEKLQKRNSSNHLSLSEEGAMSEKEVNAQFEEVVRQLHWTVGGVLDLHKDSDSSDKELNDMLEREGSGTTNTHEGTSLDALVRMVGRVDGGGIELFHNLCELDSIRSHKPAYFLHICENYVLGLVCYGSYFPITPIVHDHARIKAQTIQKIDTLIQILSQKGIPAHFSISADPTVAQLQGNFLCIFQRLRQLIEECFCQEWFSKHGSLLPTNNGHNSPLTRAQFEVLNGFIRNTLSFRGEQQREDIGQQQRQEINYEQAII